jgi:DNA polymerase III alpha subunit
MELPKFIQDKVVAKRLKDVENREHFVAELALLKSKKVSKYYEHVITNVQIDRMNPKNSYIMYLVGKVDLVELDQPSKITPGRSALPDIDTDFEIMRREEVIEYCRQRYGRDKVCQMATFSRIQGRGAMKEVLRAHQRCNSEDMNKITEAIPDEAEISDELQLMREETGESSIILWALQNNPDELKEWCFINDKGELDGAYALDFAQAIRLEGTKKSMSKHASGLIICSETLADIVPMVYDRSADEMMVGIDMRDAEDQGLVKFDILGLAALDKISMSERLIRGEDEPESLKRLPPMPATFNRDECDSAIGTAQS